VNLVIEIEAEEDASAVYAFREDLVPGSGERFLRELEQIFGLLLRHPYLGREVITGIPGIRRVKMPHYDYAVVYRLRGTELSILGVMDLRQNERGIQDRVSNRP
jgi:plasmid stabilization system protein ParE